MKISRINRHAPVPNPLFETNVPTEILFRSQSKIHSKNLVLTTRRAESGRDTRVQCRVRFVDLVTAGDPIGPDVAELIEVIDPAPGDQDEIVDVRSRL